MIHSNPEMRPSAVSLIQHRVLCPLGNKTKAQLRRELNAEKVKNEILSKQLQHAAKCLKSLAPNVTAINTQMNAGGYKLRPTPTRTSSRIVGKKVNRSNSTTNFWKTKTTFLCRICGVYVREKRIRYVRGTGVRISRDALILWYRINSSL